MHINMSCALQAVVMQDVKLPSVSRLEGQLLEAPAAAADPTPEAPLASGTDPTLLPLHHCLLSLMFSRCCCCCC